MSVKKQVLLACMIVASALLGVAAQSAVPPLPGPIAHAVIDSNGDVMGGNPVGLQVTWDATAERYEVTIPGERFYFDDYVTLVTSIDTGIVASTDSLQGKLLVVLYDPANQKRVQGMFQFACFRVWEPPTN